MANTFAPTVASFEIPVDNVDRAKSFYSAVPGSSFTVDDEFGGSYPMFTSGNGSVTG